jgi:regulator of protease activity HflC (stomatin/prohibitin superfamily)
VGPLVVVLAILAIFFFIFAASAIRIVQPYQRGVKERLGKYHETLDPGLRMIVPFVDKIRMVDMREQVVDVPPQEVITSDNVVVSVDAVVYYEPTDPQRLVYNVANFITGRHQAGPDQPAQRDRRPRSSTRPSPAATRSTSSCARSSTTPPTSGASGWCASRSSASTRRQRTSCTPCTSR